MKELFSLFNEDYNKRIIASVIFPRRAFFDCVDRVKSDGKFIEFTDRDYSGYKIHIKRPKLGNVHERTFYSIFAVADIITPAVNENGQIKEVRTLKANFYEFKKTAGFDEKTRWEFIRKVFEDLRMASFILEKDGKQALNISHLVEAYWLEKDVKENGKQRYTIYFILSTNLLRLFDITTFFSIPKETIKKINNKVKDAYLYRTIMYFMTQTRNVKIELFNLINLINNEKIDRKKKYKIKQKFLKNKELLYEFGIEVEEGSDIYLKFDASKIKHFVGVRKKYDK